MESESTIFEMSASIPDLFEKKILVVDDVDLVCRVVSKQLISAGFTDVQFQPDSRLVLDNVKSFQPDMILLDVFMPHISGMEILKQIRSINEYENVVVLMLSSAGADEQYQSLELGALGFIQKPITSEKLIQTITSKFRIARRLGIQ